MFISIWKTRNATNLPANDYHFAIRFFFIVFTDVTCWLPIVTIKAVAFLGVGISGTSFLQMMSEKCGRGRIIIISLAALDKVFFILQMTSMDGWSFSFYPLIQLWIQYYILLQLLNIGRKSSRRFQVWSKRLPAI